MEKEESNLNDIKQDNSEKNEVSDIQDSPKDNSDENNEKKELSAEEKILELEDKLARTFAEMENQRKGLRKKKKMHLNMVDIHLQKKL